MSRECPFRPLKATKRGEPSEKTDPEGKKKPYVPLTNGQPPASKQQPSKRTKGLSQNGGPPKLDRFQCSSKQARNQQLHHDMGVSNWGTPKMKTYPTTTPTPKRAHPQKADIGGFLLLWILGQSLPVGRVLLTEWAPPSMVSFCLWWLD